MVEYILSKMPLPLLSSKMPLPPPSPPPQIEFTVLIRKERIT